MVAGMLFRPLPFLLSSCSRSMRSCATGEMTGSMRMGVPPMVKAAPSIWIRSYPGKHLEKGEYQQTHLPPSRFYIGGKIFDTGIEARFVVTWIRTISWVVAMVHPRDSWWW